MYPSRSTDVIKHGYYQSRNALSRLKEPSHMTVGVTGHRYSVTIT